MKLKDKDFKYAYELCNFVNENKVKVQQIVVNYHTYILFYWEEK